MSQRSPNNLNEERVFMPLNISYATKKSSDKKLLWLIICSAIFVALIIIVVKLHSDFFYSEILGSNWTLGIAIFISFLFYTFLIRKLVIKEDKLMKLYQEALNHKLTTVNDLWEIYGIKDNIYSYYNNTHKIFLKCEKGFTVSRPANHEEEHRNAFKLFCRQLLQNNYGIEYYNYHNSDANTKPLEEYQKLIRNNPNPALRRAGAELLKECRMLEDDISNSIVEYFVITAYNTEDAGYLRSSVENAVSHLEGSLYSSVKICDDVDVMELVELEEKVSGINFTDLMKLSISGVTQEVVKPIRTFERDDIIEDNDEDELLDEEQEEFLREIQDAVKSKQGPRVEVSNLLRKDTHKRNNAEFTDKEIEEQLNYDKNKERLLNEEQLEFTPIPIDDDEIIEDAPIEVIDEDINNSVSEDTKQSIKDIKAKKKKSRLFGSEKNKLETLTTKEAKSEVSVESVSKLQTPSNSVLDLNEEDEEALLRELCVSPTEKVDYVDYGDDFDFDFDEDEEEF